MEHGRAASPCGSPIMSAWLDQRPGGSADPRRLTIGQIKHHMETLAADIAMSCEDLDSLRRAINNAAHGLSLAIKEAWRRKTAN